MADSKENYKLDLEVKGLKKCCWRKRFTSSVSCIKVIISPMMTSPQVVKMSVSD